LCSRKNVVLAKNHIKPTFYPVGVRIRRTTLRGATGPSFAPRVLFRYAETSSVSFCSVLGPLLRP